MDTLIILSPLAVGYLIKLSKPQWLQQIDRSLTALVYLILAIMGMNLAGIDNLSDELNTITAVVATLVGLTLVANLALLPLIDRIWPLPIKTNNTVGHPLKMAAESLQLALVVLAGFVLGLFVKMSPTHLDQIAMSILMLLLLLIGIQMRASGMSWRQILLNPRGLAIAAIVLLTSLLAGAITALCYSMPIHHGLALAAGVGWYSLSGAMISQELGPIMGSIAFLSDLARELIAIILIPVLMQRSPASAIGYGGATAMDFTLPVIQRSGGPNTVPVAIVAGFLLSLAGPILIPLFLNW
ncbi:lysine exporter LysO family protein [Ferrimonas lipolytica]|uniref:Lysine exporter LysO family protein n=1 Tax=Ferrimonas lipolytica TaxID=2724191 RepID=A0A6H1UHR8_9GAMM|nr:lysine exporter LysO family protein [Ferrimonas lipolytica]QIZ78584.1 lysine exporter LysO family protein [Ferrimonas lipolytica]